MVPEKPIATWVTDKCSKVHTDYPSVSSYKFLVVVNSSDVGSQLPARSDVILDPKVAPEVRIAVKEYVF